jgi:uncharacterized protein
MIHNMPLSKFLHTFKNDGKEDQVLLFSAMRCSKALITKEIWKAMETNDLAPQDEALFNKLGMIVKDRDEEKKTVSGIFEELNKKITTLDIIAVLNLDCNFACRYCFEGSLKGKIYMAEENAARLVDFIKEHFNEGKRALHVDFYGGEPLLSLELIRKISKQLNQFARERNAAFTFGLVTNGSLFKKETAEELAELGLKNVKITVDGPAHIHNKNRPFKSGAPSFDILIKNIKDACGLVKLTIGGNYEKDNYKEFPMLLDYFINEGITPDKLNKVKFDAVMRKSDRVLSPMELIDGCASMDEQWIRHASLFLREEILKRGFKTPGVMTTFCSVESQHFWVVNYDGTLYKCPGFIGMKEYSAGDIFNGAIDYPAACKPGIWKNEECLECSYLPLCFGGCRYFKFVEEGKIDSPQCQKKFFDACLETLVKQDIKYGLKAEK